MKGALLMNELNKIERERERDKFVKRLNSFMECIGIKYSHCLRLRHERNFLLRMRKR